jgi:hypothetical protein
LCGVLLVASTALLLRAPDGSGAPADPGGRVAAQFMSGSLPGAASGFVPVAAAERWPTHARPSAPAWLVQAELPRERLAEYGLPFDPTRAGQAVRAELLMRANGEVLAVRLIEPPPFR